MQADARPIGLAGRGQVTDDACERERQLAQLVDMVPSHLWRLAPDGEPLFFNQRMVDFIGKDVADLDRPGSSRLGSLIKETIHPDDEGVFSSAVGRGLATGEAVSFRYRLRRVDGVYRWMSSRAEPVKDRAGRIVQWYGVCHDVDDQVRAEAVLRRSEAELQQTIDAVPARIWSATSMDGPIYFNKRYKDYLRSVIANFDALEEPRIEQFLRELIHPEDAAQVQSALQSCFQTGSGGVMRFRWREKDGAYKWAQCRVEPWRDSDGTIVRWYGVSHDIDDEMLVQERLRERERELSLFVDMIPSHLWRVSPEGTTTLTNRHMADFLGRDLGDQRDLEMVFDDIFHPDDAAGVWEVFNRCLASGETFAMKYRLRRADGVYRWMSGRAEPLRDDNGRILQWFGLCHDIDDQMHAEEALRRASSKLARAAQVASLAELSASIAHEVNQPLAAVVANSQACHRWLSADPPNIERAKVTAERITRDANSAADVVTRIRMLFQRAPRPRLSEDLNRLIAEVCRLMADEIAVKRVGIKTRLELHLPLVAVDRVQIQQVLVNLIRNGIESMDDVSDGERTLEISSYRNGAEDVRVEVRDGGTGFKNEERAFEPFFTTKQHGMGMGLAICRSIVESHGGSLWVANNEQRGATVTFSLRRPIDAP